MKSRQLSEKLLSLDVNLFKRLMRWPKGSIAVLASHRLPNPAENLDCCLLRPTVTVVTEVNIPEKSIKVWDPSLCPSRKVEQPCKEDKGPLCRKQGFSGDPSGTAQYLT